MQVTKTCSGRTLQPQNKAICNSRLAFGMNPQEEKAVFLQIAKKVAPAMRVTGSTSVSTTISVVNGFKETDPELYKLVERMKAERAFEDTPLYHGIQEETLGDRFKLIDPVNSENIWKSVSQKFEIAVTQLAAVFSGKKQLRLDGANIPNSAYLEDLGKPFAGVRPERNSIVLTSKSSIKSEITTVLNNIVSWFRCVEGGYENPANKAERMLYARNPEDLDRLINA